MALCDECGIDATGGTPELAEGLHAFATGAAAGPLALGGWNAQFPGGTPATPSGYTVPFVTNGLMTLDLSSSCTDRVRQVEVSFWGNHNMYADSGTTGDGFSGFDQAMRFVPAWQVWAPYGSGVFQTMNIDQMFSAYHFAFAGGNRPGVTMPVSYWQSFLLTIPAGATAPLTVAFRPMVNPTMASARRYRFYSTRPMFGRLALYHV